MIVTLKNTHNNNNNNNKTLKLKMLKIDNNKL